MCFVCRCEFWTQDPMLMAVGVNQIDEICRVSVKRRAQALRLISLAGSRSGLVGLLTVTHPLPSDTPGGRVGLCRGQRPSFRGRCAGGWGDVTHYLAG